jgi:hypothetical protein
MANHAHVELPQRRLPAASLPVAIHPVVWLKRFRRVMASIVVWLIGFLALGLGVWILSLRFEGLVDWLRPHNMSIATMTVDGQDSKGHAELLRARFNHHFRRSLTIPRDTGFLEVVTLNAPDLFQPKGPEGELKAMSIDVSGVDVTKVVRLINQLFKPDEWVVEGDFQIHSGRALLSLRLRRGPRLIRTWYLERLGGPDEKAQLMEQLIDDAVFQLVYDFGNEAEDNPDLKKWRWVVAPPVQFPSRAALAAYYDGRGALAQYYAHGDWNDLDRAVNSLRKLRAQMPAYQDGLQLLAMALAEKREETEAIHAYEHLRLLLVPEAKDFDKLSPSGKREVLQVDLLKGTATAKLFTWQSAHEAITQLEDVSAKLDGGWNEALPDGEKAAHRELQAQTAAQLAYTYALYLDYLRRFTVFEVFGSTKAPKQLASLSKEDLVTLKNGPPDKAKAIVQRLVKAVMDQHSRWLQRGQAEQAALENSWQHLVNGVRREAELVSRLHIAAGYFEYRMAEWEPKDTLPNNSTFGRTFQERLEQAASHLRIADKAHPNHYLVLQLLGLVHSEPRYEGAYLSIAEQYFERAIQANPSDYHGHELLAEVLLHRTVNRGVDLANRLALEQGLAAVQAAIKHRETSGTAHLRRAEFRTMLLEIERDVEKRRELNVGLAQDLSQAERFLPRAFDRPDPDLSWVRLVAAVRQPQTSRGQLLDETDKLIADCVRLEERWVAQQRLFHVQALKARVTLLRQAIDEAPRQQLHAIPIPFQ